MSEPTCIYSAAFPREKSLLEWAQDEADGLRTQLAAVTKERDGWKGAADIASKQWGEKCAQVTELKCSLQEMKRERDEAVAFLREALSVDEQTSAELDELERRMRTFLSRINAKEKP